MASLTGFRREQTQLKLASPAIDEAELPGMFSDASRDTDKRARNVVSRDPYETIASNFGPCPTTATNIYLVPESKFTMVSNLTLSDKV
jgi:hypothetical protein